MMFISLSLGNVLLCLFHVIRHALAKANLFLRVGNVLHSRFSQQDSRALLSGNISRVVGIRIIVRIARLRGGLFLRGYFRKEQILIATSERLTRGLVLVLFLRMSRITLAYCIKLAYSVLFREGWSFHFLRE
jgi:NADH-quinone oxidoreductase subunit L